METIDLVERAKAFVAAVAAGAPDAALEAFYAPDVEQTEFPNRFVPDGAVRDLSGLREAAARGRQTMSAQSFEVINALRTGDCVALEAIWTGTLAVAVGALRPGDVMTARFAQFFEFENDLIRRQRNYDCFDPY